MPLKWVEWLLYQQSPTSAGVVRGPVFAGHAHDLWALSLVPLLAADFTARPHNIPVVLSSGCATAHVTMFHLDGRTPWSPCE